MLNCGGCLAKQPRRILQLCRFSRDAFSGAFFSHSCLHMPNSFSVLELLFCYLDCKFFSNFTHIFMANTVLSIEEQSQKAKGVPPWLIAEVQLLSTLKHLASANRKTAEIGEIWVWFGLRDVCINYDLTGDLWWIYAQEVSYSLCITQNVRGDLWVQAEEDSGQGWSFRQDSCCVALSENNLKAESDLPDFYICIIFVRYIGFTKNLSKLGAHHGVLHNILQTCQDHSRSRASFLNL